VKRGAVYLLAQENNHVRVGEDALLQAEGSRILRPVVLVSRDAINDHSAVVLVCPLVDATSVHVPYPSDVAVQAPEAGLTADSLVMTGQLHAVARTQLVRQLGAMSAEVMREIDRALRITLDLE
jgi:mRNA interferase MazF